VIGFMGNTGDAQSTPYHLHFEIHPVALLPLGYDGVVRAYPVPDRLAAARDVSFAAGRGWAPPVPRPRRRRAGSVPARLERHLERERASSRVARAGARRPGLGRSDGALLDG
jgi:murein DD-endopeptidase MepM/ murein hydrolase activator NlpD